MSYKNILVVKMSAIGDVIHALPVAYALKQSFPQAKITWVVEKAALDLVSDNSYIDEVIIFEKQKFRSLRGLIDHLPSFSRMLKSRQFDLCLDLQGLMKSAAIALLSGAPVRLGYCNMRELSGIISKPVCGGQAQQHIVERYLDVVRGLGCAVHQVVFPINTQQQETTVREIAGQAGLDIDRPYLVLVPGANWLNKRWPTQRYAQLADKLYSRGIIPVIVGASADYELAEQIKRHSKVAPVDLTAKTSLKQLAFLLKQARAVVAGDTGPMHLAAAVGTPVVALFGPTDPRRNGPYGRNNIVITAGVDCLGCWQRTCDKPCLATIHADTVDQALQKLLNCYS